MSGQLWPADAAANAPHGSANYSGRSRFRIQDRRQQTVEWFGAGNPFQPVFDDSIHDSVFPPTPLFPGGADPAERGLAEEGAAARSFP